MFNSIYTDMNKHGLIGIKEGAIDSKEVADKVFDGIKDIIKEYSREYKDEPLSEEQLVVIIDGINAEIKSKLVDSGISPCPIKFDNLEMGRGAYIKDKKEIHLSLNYLIDYSDIIEFLDTRSIDFNDMRNTLEHELIHQIQDDKSKGRFLRSKILNYVGRKYVDKSGNASIGDILDALKRDRKLYDIYVRLVAKILEKDYYELLSRQKFIDPDISDNKFLELVIYYNDRSELNTFAKEAVNKYIRIALNSLKVEITIEYRRGAISKNEFDSKEVRALIVPFVDFDTDKYNVEDKRFIDQTRTLRKHDFKTKIVSYYEGYKYLTKKNKKQWWKYVFQLLMNVKFDPIIKKN